jgi:hypothetical protein
MPPLCVSPTERAVAPDLRGYSMCSTPTRLYDERRIYLSEGEVLSEGSKVGPPATHVIETEIDGDISLYNPSNEQVTVLNGTASDVWALCDGEHSIGEIKRLLAASYGTAEPAISDDVERTIESFQKAGLLQP